MQQRDFQSRPSDSGRRAEASASGASRVRSTAAATKAAARERSPVRTLLLLCAALALLVGADYSRVVGNHFIDYDDPAYITANPHIRAGLTLDTAIWAFTTGHRSNWHPLTWLSHALDVTLFGLDPAGHHLVSLALHAANAVLLLLALFLMTGAPWRSAVVAALFALHPLHVESVAWAAERKDVLSTFFWMLTLVLYARHVARPAAATRWLTAVALGLGLLAKPMLVTLPFILLLLDFWPLRRFGGEAEAQGRRLVPPPRLFREKLPLFVLVAASCIVTWVVQQRGGAVAALEAVPFGARLANASVAYVTYLVQTFWPSGLGVLYPYAAPLPAWKVIGSCAVLAAITIGVLKAARRAPYLVTGWFWCIGALVPVIGLVQVGVQSHADRYTYVPLIGIFLMLAWGIPDLSRAWRYRRLALAAAALAALVGCAILTWRQVGYWRDSVTLFEHTLQVTADNYIVDNNLGAALTGQGRLDEGLRYLEEARRIRPDHAPTLSNLGVALQGKGRVQEAINLYREAVKFKPTHVEAWFNLGNALEKTGDLDGAIAAFREAAQLQPDDPAIAGRLQAAVAAKQRPASAPQGYAGAAGDALADYQQGNALRDQGRLDDATAAYRAAIRLDPNFAEAHNNLGSVLGRQGRSDEAILELSKALELDPKLAAAHNNLAILFATRGQTENAAGQFAEVLRLDPRDAGAHFNLGLLLARQGKLEEAIAHYEEALKIQPDNQDARRALEHARRRAGRVTAPER